MKLPTFRLRTLLVSIAACAALLVLARYWRPVDGGSITVAGGVEPLPQFLVTLEGQLLKNGYAMTPRPARILCIDGDWKWYRSETEPCITIGVDFEQQDCLVAIWYDNPWWLPLDLGTTEHTALHVARDLELRMRKIMTDLSRIEKSSNREIHGSSGDRSDFMIGSFTAAR